jgi:hypothetical protein
LLDRGFSHRAITLLLVAINLGLIAFVYFERTLGCTILVLSVFAFFFSFISLCYYARSKPRWAVAKKNQLDSNDLKSTKVVALTKDSILEQKN